MIRKEEKTVEYNIETEKLFISFLVNNYDLYVRAAPAVKGSFFSKQFQSTVDFIKTYSEKYSAVPTVEQIKATTGVEIERLTEDAQKPQHVEWFLNNFESFCRHRALEAAILKSTDDLEKGNYNIVEQRVKEAISVSLHHELGTDYFLDPKGRNKALLDQNGNIKTLLTELDKTFYGGLGRKELVLFLAPTNGGKSMVMQNITTSLIMQGLNVVYITLEMSEELCAKRVDSMLTGMANHEIFRKLDQLETLVKQKEHSAGKLQFKFMFSGSTVNDIKAYLKDYEIRTGTKVDAIVVDYLDLLAPNNKKIDMSNLYIKDKFVSEELRSLAAERDLLCVSACQLGRSSYESGGEFGNEMVQGGLSKIQTCDVAVGVMMTPQMRENRRIQFQIMKSRNSSGVGRKIDLKFDTDALRISDLDEGDTGGNVSTNELLSSLKKKNVITEKKDESEKKVVVAPTEESKVSHLDRLRRLSGR